MARICFWLRGFPPAPLADPLRLLSARNSRMFFPISLPSGMMTSLLCCFFPNHIVERLFFGVVGLCLYTKPIRLGKTFILGE